MDEREKEKSEMRRLNEKLADYIEKVRFLEAQNKQLELEIEKLKAQAGDKSTAIREMYEEELRAARTMLDRLGTEKGQLEMQIGILSGTLEEQRVTLIQLAAQSEVDQETMRSLTEQLAQVEPEIKMLERRIAALMADQEKNKFIINQLQNEITKTKMDLENETMAHIEAENRRQALEEEIEFLKSIYEQELKDLEALAYRDSTPENREYWKHELASAIRDIQNAYDTKLQQVRNEMESRYMLKVNECQHGAERNLSEAGQVKEDNIKLRTTVSDLRNKLSELEAKTAQLMRQLEELRLLSDEKTLEWDAERLRLLETIAKLKEDIIIITEEANILTDKKLSLELEIVAYRKLLEDGEMRLGGTAVEEVSSSGAAGGRSQQLIIGQMQAKTTYQRSAKGSITIQETNPEGKFIQIENTGKRDENLEGWSIRRTIDGGKIYEYMFPRFVLRNKNSVKVWAKGMVPKGSRDLEFRDSTTWGIGKNVTTVLYNDRGDERANLVQKTNFAA